MAQNKNLQKLELTWIGKGDEPKLEPRILIENPEYSYWEGKDKGKPAPWGNNPISNNSKNNPGNPSNPQNHVPDNMLIHGDNLLALKALEQDYAGKVKCIYIDPPYNTGNAFEHYDDGIEHSLWLNLMKPRLEILRTLLADDGSIWISIDENEGHYLKVLCDEIFGRKNYIIQTIIQRGGVTGHKAINPTPVQVADLMLCYAKNKDKWEYKPVYRERGYDEAYSKYILNYEDNYTDWKFTNIKEVLKSKNTTIDNLLKLNPERIIRFAQPSYDSVGQATRDLIDISKKDSSKVYLLKREGYPDIYLWKGDRILFYKDKMKNIDGNLVTAELVSNIWTDMKYQGIAKEGNVTFAKSKKPEAQVRRILEMSTNPGDLVLDSFLGSGTTAAVAHKMGRKYIGIELGEHAITHCYPRLKQVVDGEQGGISKAVNWHGGGGFKFYTLAPSLLKKDKFGQWIMSDEYNADMLAAAMAKQEGFKYNPSETQFWKQGNSSEQDFIFTTTQFLTVQQLEAIAEDMQAGESLLICCKAFQTECKNKFPNITIKKIPQLLLDRCEFGKDDYSLNIVNIPSSEQDFNDFEDGQDFFDDEEENDKETTDKNPTLFE